MRFGELKHFKLIPHTPYCGTADATPLCLITLHETWRWTGDLERVRSLMPVAEGCLRWIDEWGDRDGDGFQECQTRSSLGYENVAWKDAGDSVPYLDGTLVKGPEALWGLVATTAMASILQASQSLGLSRMSLTFLMGSAVSGNRSRATVFGFVLYILGGWASAILYFPFFASVGIHTWRLGVTRARQLEPPGFLALDYGLQTPLVTLLAQGIYGGVLGACVRMQHAMGG